MQVVWVTLGCNNACGFCPQREARAGDASGFFAGDEVAARVQRAARTGETVALVGGEPTLRPDLPALIALARREGARAVVVQTNGRRLSYPAYAAELRAAGATAVDVSLHGSTAAIHEFHTATAGSFAQTLTGLGVARAAGLRVGVSSVLTRSNYRHASELVRLIAARGVRALHLAAARQPAQAPSLPPSLVPNAALLAPHLHEAVRLARSLGMGVLLDGRASEASLLELFAGAGPVVPGDPEHDDPR